MVTPGAAQALRQIDLKEYERSDPLPLTPAERDTLRSAIASLTIDSTSGVDGVYILRPGSTVGAVEIDGLSVRIEPKIGIAQLLSLACYAINKVDFQPTEFDFPKNEALPDILAFALGRAARRAFVQGLLHGYREEEEALYTVRGRIRFDDQLRRRFGVPLPVEVRYDEFTDDIPANRVIKAAAHKLRGMRLRSDARVGLGWVAAMLDNVSLVEFTPKDVPAITFDRLNAHYRAVVALARLILRRNAFAARRGDVDTVRASGFLMDMNKVFQDFVTVALRDALGLTERQFKEDNIPSLDEGGQVRLKPDLVWREGERNIFFVGDAKYKAHRARERPQRRPLPAPSLRHRPQPPRRPPHLRERRGRCCQVHRQARPQATGSGHPRPRPPPGTITQQGCAQTRGERAPPRGPRARSAHRVVAPLC